AFQLACGHRSRITSIAVSLNCQKVFVGDRGGTVSRTLVNVPDGSCESSVFLEEMSPVVKLEYCQRRLLVATEAQAAVYSDDGSCVWIVGGKRWETPSPLGACFLPDPSLPSRTSLLCAQPHWHLWLADLQGQVSASLALPQPSAAALRARPIPLLTPSRPLTEPDSKTNSSIRVVRIPSTRTVAMWNRAALHLLDLDSGELVGSTDLLAPLLDVVATEDGELMVLRAGSLYPQVVRLSTDQWSPAGRTQQRPTSMIEDESLAELPRLDERFNLQSLLDRLPLGERAVSQLLQSSADSASVAAAANIEFGEEAQEEEKPDNVEEPFDDFNDLADDNDELVVRRIVPKLSRHGPPPATVASPTPEPLAPSTSSASSAAERREDPKNRQENPQEPPSPSVALARLQWAVDDQPAASSLLHQSAAINPIQQLPSGPAKLELLKDQQTNRWWPHRCPEPLTSLCASAAPSLESGTALFATKSGSAYSARVLSNQGDARLRWQVESSLASVVSGDQLLQLQAAPPDLVLRLTASGRKLSAGRISGVGYRVSEWKTVREGVRCLGAGSARYLCGLDAGGGVFLVPMADVGQQLPGASVECPFRPASISIGQGHLVCMASQQQQHHHRHHQSAAPTELWAAPLSAPDRWWPIGRCSGGLLAALVTEFNLWTLTASGEGDGCCLRCWRGGSWLESEDLPALELWIAELDKPAHNKRSDLPWRVLTSALAGVGAVSDASAGAAAAPFIVSVPNFGLWLYWPDRDLLLTCSGPCWAQHGRS
uniref:Mcl1_mid domain-containing protein n=1 Tax=Macrostomum lignano TaxID=282301 RepID=A0A1I8IHB0_9PLAT